MGQDQTENDLDSFPLVTSDLFGIGTSGSAEPLATGPNGRDGKISLSRQAGREPLLFKKAAPFRLTLLLPLLPFIPQEEKRKENNQKQV